MQKGRPARELSAEAQRYPSLSRPLLPLRRSRPCSRAGAGGRGGRLTLRERTRSAVCLRALRGWPLRWLPQQCRVQTRLAMPAELARLRVLPELCADYACALARFSARTGTSTVPVAVTPTNSGDPLDALRARCVQRTNEYRARVSVAPIARRPDREACADGAAQSDGVSGSAHGAFGRCQEGAQNECPGWPGSPDQVIDRCLEQMFAEGPGPFAGHGHYLNMTAPELHGRGLRLRHRAKRQALDRAELLPLNERTLGCGRMGARDPASQLVARWVPTRCDSALQCQPQHQRRKHDAIVAKGLQTAPLQVADEDRDHPPSDEERHEHSHPKLGAAYGRG